MIVTSGQQYNVGEKPTVILDTFYAGPPNITKQTILQYIGLGIHVYILTLIKYV